MEWAGFPQDITSVQPWARHTLAYMDWCLCHVTSCVADDTLMVGFLGTRCVFPYMWGSAVLASEVRIDC